MERIVAAAILWEDRHPIWLPAPARHHNVLHLIHYITLVDHVFGAQGFMTSEGRFVEREEAGQIALAAGQTDKLKWGPDLYSEDLW
jgi:hypothetical protein